MDVLLFIVGVLVMALAIGFSIGFHEIGHLLPAKKFGVRVPQYMIGFGKTVFSWKRGETEYGIKAIPLGGYISMIGMYPPRSDSKLPTQEKGPLRQLVEDARAADQQRIKEGDENRVFYKLPVYKRIVIMLGGPAMNLLIGLVCTAVLIMGFGTPQLTTTVSSISQCVKTASASQEPCTENDAQAPALVAGIQAGDTITSYAGEKVNTWEDLTSLIRTHRQGTVSVTVERDGQEKTLSLQPAVAERPIYDQATNTYEKNADGSYKTEPVGFIGVAPQSIMVQGNITDVLPSVGEQLKNIYSAVLTLPQRVWGLAVTLATNGERDVNGPMSVVGVGRIAGEVAATDQINANDKVVTLVSLIGGLNLFLFAFNLVPLLPLDGGHVLGALWEALRRGYARLTNRQDPGAFDAARLLPLTFIVAGAFMVMSLVLILADLFKPITLL